MNSYRIGEFSKLTGVSADTLRFYEKKGVLHPQHLSENNYRVYSDHDLLELMQLRLMRSMELSIASLQHPDELNLDKLLSTFEGRIQTIESEIDVLTRKLERLKRLHRELHECRALVGDCRNVVVPPLHCLYYDQSAHDPCLAQQIADWCAHISYVHLTFRLRRDQLLLPDDQPMTAVMGIGILSEYADACGIHPVPPAVSTPAVRATRFLLCISDPLQPTRAVLDPVFAYLKKNSLQSVGDWNYRLRFIERQMDGTARCYIALRLCTEPC